jgi:hypothetical protein
LILLTKLVVVFVKKVVIFKSSERRNNLMSKGSRAIRVDSLVKETPKCWVVSVNGKKANFAKSQCNQHSELEYIIPVWLYQKITGHKFPIAA